MPAEETPKRIDFHFSFIGYNQNYSFDMRSVTGWTKEHQDDMRIHFNTPQPALLISGEAFREFRKKYDAMPDAQPYRS